MSSLGGKFFKNTKPVTSLVLALILSAISLPAAADIHAVEGIPDGFETLATPRQTMVTVYYGGDMLGTFPAHFTPSTLQFDRPDTIIEAIPAIKDKPKVISVLVKPMPVNADRLCTAKRTEDCGKISPETVGVIFDEDHLSAELFFNKDILSVVSQNDQYLPLPERQFSSTENLNGAISGSSTQSPDFTLSTNNNYSFGEAKIQTQSTASNNGLRFDSAVADVDRRGWNASTGLFRSKAMELISDQDVGGVSVSTSMHTLTDANKTQGNDVVIYLPRRAFVSIYREGRLYSAHDYEAGNQQLDTSELPDGAYTITLKIQESDGTVREETRFFAKTQHLPPPDRPVYYAQAGFIRKSAQFDSTVPQLTSHPIAQAGTIQRVDDNFGLSSSILGVQDRAATELGAFWIEGGRQVQTTLMYSSKGDRGIQAGVVQTTNKLSLSADVRDVWMSNTPMAGYDTWLRNLSQAEMTASFAATEEVTLGLRGSYTRQTGMSTTLTLGPYAQWNVWQSGESSLGVSADAARTANHVSGTLLMHYSYRFGNYGITGAAGDQFGQASHGPLGNMRVWHDDPTPGNSLLLGAGVNADRQNRVLSGDADWRNDLAQIRGGVQQSYGQNSSALGYGGTFAVGAAQLADELYVGGSQSDTSAVVVEATGDADTVMKIYVNGVQKSSVKVGSKQTIFLTPFHSYNIRLVPEKSGMFDYDSADHKVTLYPGNVSKLSWAINKFYVIAAHIKTPTGQALADAILKESRAQIATDSQGFLQAELGAPDTLTFTQKDGALCHVALPKNVKPVNGVMIYKEALICQP